MSDQQPAEYNYRREMGEDTLLGALEWLNEVTPSLELFNRLVEEGAGFDSDEEKMRVKLEGDDLAGLCHAIHTLYTYFGYDPAKVHHNQELQPQYPLFDFAMIRRVEKVRAQALLDADLDIISTIDWILAGAPE